MEYEKLKEKVKNLGFRVTKDVKGKRVKLSKKELMAKLPKKTSLENQAKSAKKFIKVCKMVLKEAEPTQPRAPRVVRQPVRVSPRRVAPPPPPPPPPPKNARAALMADLRANLKRRGLANT
jgi:hypothetical protein